MIIFEILTLILSLTLLITSISGLGNIVSYKFYRNNIINIFFGFIILGIYSTFIHFFFKITLTSNIIIFLIGIFLFIISNKKDFFRNINKSNFYYFFIIFFLIPILISQKYHEDFGYYHLPYAISFLEEKIIFGFANVNYAYIYNSLWLNISSLFFLSYENFNFLTLHSFILYSIFIIFLCKNILGDKKHNLSNIFSTLVLFYFLLKFTRISEYGVDLPAAMYAILSIIFFLKFFEVAEENKKNFYFFCNLSFSVFAILIKLSVLPIFILTFYLFFKFYFLKSFLYLKFNFLFIYICFIVFFVQQFIYTGCIIFPSITSCLDVSWFNNDFATYKNKLELINKSYSEARSIFSPEEYLKNLNWLSFWLKRNFIEILEHILTMIIPITLYLFFLNKKIENNKFSSQNIFILVILFLINLIFWLMLSPVFRFGIHFFTIFSFLIILYFFRNKIFSKKVFLIFLCICLSFSLLKNIKRISEKDKFFFGIEMIKNQYKSNQIQVIDDIRVLTPDIEKNMKNGWQGRLCWDIPFVCSYNKINISKKNKYLIFKKFND
jgi:hypothetical protein